MTQVHWLNAVDGNFGVATDWSGGSVPGPSVDAVLDAAGAAFSVTVTNDGTVNGVDLAANATLRIDATFTATNGTDGGANAGSIFVAGRFYDGGTMTNTGSLTLAGVDLVQGAVTLDGAGSVVLEGHGVINGASGRAAVLTNIDNTISGSGTLGRPGNDPSPLSVINEAAGVIDANVSRQILVLNRDRPSVNAGLMEATNGGFLSIGLTQVDNDGGTIEASGGGTVNIGGVYAEITGGSIVVGAASGILLGDGCQAKDVSLDVAKTGTLDVYSQSTLTTEGITTNAGTIVVSPNGIGPSSLVIDGNMTLTGGGAVDCRGSTIEGSGTAAVLTNVDNTISGWGELGDGRMVLKNDAGGVIVCIDSPLTIDTGVRTIINAGLIEAGKDGASLVESALRNAGTIEATAGGVLTIDGPVVGTAGRAIAAGGTLDFASSFDQNVMFEGASSVLKLAQSQTYTGVLRGFSNVGLSTLDLGDIGFVSSSEATYSGTSSSGVLTVTDGARTAHIALAGNHLGATFVASSDGHGGTDVTTTAGDGVARFVQALVTIGARPFALASSALDAWRAPVRALSSPHIQSA